MTTDQVPAGAAQAVPADTALRERVADALNEADAWAQLQRRDDRERFADAALAALPELAALDRLRTRLAELVDELTREASSYYAAHEYLAGSDHQAAVAAHVRWQMATDAAARLRALLEET